MLEQKILEIDRCETFRDWNVYIYLIYMQCICLFIQKAPLWAPYFGTFLKDADLKSLANCGCIGFHFALTYSITSTIES